MGGAVWGVTMVKDEVDVIEGVLRHMAGEVDCLLVADNGSTDGTRDVLSDLTADLPMTVVDDPETAYWQSRKMTRLAAAAAEAGAEWIVPFDADELWFAYGDRVRDVLTAWPAGARVVRARLTNHFCTALDEVDPDPFRRMVWRQADAQVLGKVAFRWEPGAVIEQGNHAVTLPEHASTGPEMLGIRHFPYRSADHMIRKARNGSDALKLTDLPDDSGAHWRDYGRLLEQGGEQVLRDVFQQYFWKLSPIDDDMVRDPAPYRRWEQP